MKSMRIKTCWDSVAPVQDGEASYHEAFSYIEDVSVCARKLNSEVDNNINSNKTTRALLKRKNLWSGELNM